MRTGLFSCEGVIRAAPKQDGCFKKQKDFDVESVKVCLNCTRKKCSGADECFKRRKAQQGMR